jgi:hypothetical protein
VFRFRSVAISDCGGRLPPFTEKGVFKMKRLALVLLLLSGCPALAQQPPSRPTTEKDVTPLAQPILPLPDSNRIVIPYNDTARVYFKRAFKNIRIEDTDVVRARPESDHVIEFGGLAPGTSPFILEGADGSRTAKGEIIVTREVHEVKIFTPTAPQKAAVTANNSTVVINQAPEGGPDAKKSAEAEYSSRLCNEVGCRPVPEAR